MGSPNEVANGSAPMTLGNAAAAQAMKGEAEIEGLPRRLESAHLPRHAGQMGSGWQPGQAGMARVATVGPMPIGSNSKQKALDCASPGLRLELLLGDEPIVDLHHCVPQE
jgi:hypothetical protein